MKNMKTKHIFKFFILTLLVVFGVHSVTLANFGFAKKQRFPITWIKQQTTDTWSFIQGVTGPHQVSASLVEVKEEPQVRRLASATNDEVITYKIESIKKNIDEVKEEQLKKHQLMILISAP